MSNGNNVSPLSAVQSFKSGKPIPKKTAESWGDPLNEEIREAMIFYGEWRSGKTNGYLDLIQSAHVKRPNTRAFVINTDNSVSRNIKEFPYLESMDIVKARFCNNIEEVLVASSQLVGSNILTKDDWIIIDLASMVWNELPEFYCKQVLDKSVDEIELQNFSKGGSAILSYYKSGINPMWFRWEKALRLSGAHIILVCGEKPLAEEDIRGVRKADKNETIRSFQSIGTVPRIQRDTPFQYHTIMYFSQPYTQRFYVQTVGEKGIREWIQPRLWLNNPDKPVSFGDLYINEIAQWREE